MSNDQNHITDRELVERFQDGDRSVFDVLVDRHSAKAYQIAYGVLGNREDAEEVSQDVFVRIYRALHKFRGDSEFSTWMYRIAINLARNKYRWNKSRGLPQRLSIDEPISNKDGSESKFELTEERLQPNEEVELDEFEKNVMEQLHGLPPVYRDALLLRNVEDMSYEDIASTLGCKLGTIKSRIARAREELRRRLNI